jgi:class 3 adenylate cyclase
VQGLPSGTVTFLFTDIEGSTRLLRELGERYADVLAEHNRILREAFSRHGGLEMGTQGDSFFVAFADAGSAVAAAGDVQAALAGGPVGVRIGIHTGEAVVTDEGYVGIDVHRAARIMGAGHGGQVLLSETTRRLLGDSRELVDLGEHRLKDLGAPHPAVPIRRPSLSAAAHAVSDESSDPGDAAGRPAARARGGGRARSLQPSGDADRARRERQDAARAAARR